LPKEIILPSGAAVDVRIINYEQIDILDQGLGPQQVLVIDNKIFYAIEEREKNQTSMNHSQGKRGISLHKQILKK